MRRNHVLQRHIRELAGLEFIELDTITIDRYTNNFDSNLGSDTAAVSTHNSHVAYATITNDMPLLSLCMDKQPDEVIFLTWLCVEKHIEICDLDLWRKDLQFCPQSLMIQDEIATRNTRKMCLRR